MGGVFVQLPEGQLSPVVLKSNLIGIPVATTVEHFDEGLVFVRPDLMRDAFWVILEPWIIGHVVIVLLKMNTAKLRIIHMLFDRPLTDGKHFLPGVGKGQLKS